MGKATNGLTETQLLDRLVDIGWSYIIYVFRFDSWRNQRCDFGQPEFSVLIQE